MRVLVVTGDNTLAVGVGTVGAAIDATVVRSLEPAVLDGAPFDVAVLDLGSTDLTTATVGDLAPHLASRTVVVADGPTGIGDATLVRPFALDDLRRVLAGEPAPVPTAFTARRRLHRLPFGRRDGELRAPRAAASAGGAEPDAGAKPRALPRFRSARPVGPVVDADGTIAAVEAAADLARRLTALGGKPDRWALAWELVEGVAAELPGRHVAVWGLDGGGYRVLACTGAGLDRRIGGDDPVVVALATSLDGVLLTGPHPTALRGTANGDVVAVAIRWGEQLAGVLVVSGFGLTVELRDRLLERTRPAAPAFTLATIVDGFAARRILVVPEGTTQSPE